MIKDNWGMFNLHEVDDTLLLLFSSQTANKFLDKKEVIVLLHDDEVVGYKIPNFIRFAKIKYSGIIFLPSNPLVDIINSILENNNLEKLPYKNKSGYIVKTNEQGIRGVYALEGTFLRDMSVSQGRYVSYYDLYIDIENAHELIEIEENIKEGTDFFQMEEKGNA